MHVTILVQIYPYFSCFKVASAITMTKVGINLHWYGYMCRQPPCFIAFSFYCGPYSNLTLLSLPYICVNYGCWLPVHIQDFGGTNAQ